MAIDDYKLPSYPVVKFLARRGKPLAIALAALLPVAGLASTVLGGSVWPLAGGLAAGALLAVLLYSYVEVLQIIADTLMPK